MGLQNQLSDVSSESFLIIAVVLIGKSVNYLNSLLFTILHHLRLFSPPLDSDSDSPPYDVVGSGLAGIVLLCEQLNLNRSCSYPTRTEFGSDCVVCLNKLCEGEQVRRLACRHVFHKDCLDGWLNELNFSCPLCRRELVEGERVGATRRRVEGDLLAWFPIR